MMLDTTSWRGFKIENLFNRFERGKAIQVKLEDGDDIFYVGAKHEDNGVMFRCAYDETLVSKGNCIVFICDGQGSVGLANYMDRDFIGTTNLMLGYADWLNSQVGMFLATVFSLERPKYSFGRKWARFLKDTVVQLPVESDASGSPIVDPDSPYSSEGYIPDWQSMEDFIKGLNYKPLSTSNKVRSMPKWDEFTWRSFSVGSIFSIRNGRGITTSEIEENPGNLNAVQSGEENNGVIGKISLGFCRENNYVFTEHPCLTVARTGSAGFVSFQADGCVVGDSAKMLQPRYESLSTASYLFLQTVLNQNRFKFSYGRKVTEEKYLTDVISLPVKIDSSGKPIIRPNSPYSPEGYVPDWQFMEDYMRSLPYGDRIPEVGEF